MNLFRNSKIKGSSLILILVALVICMTLAACDKQHLYSIGSRAGVVQKLSFKGDDDEKKTWEGELVMNPTTNAIWLFSVDPADGDVVNQLNTARQQGTRVDLEYHQYKNANTDRTYQTEYRIKKVTFLK